MNHDKLKKLTRGELLELFLAQSEELERENKAIEELGNQLETRRNVISQASSVAEATMELSGTYEVAQKAATKYVENVRALTHSAKTTRVEERFPDSTTSAVDTESTIHKRARKTGQGDIPNIERIREELNRVNYWNKYLRVLRSTSFTLLVVASAAVLAATLWIPVLRIYGHSMAPTLSNGDIVVTVKENDFKTGEVVAFYYNNKILVKRAIAQAGDWVDIDKDGTVYVNGKVIDEPYIEKKAFGDTNITLPYQVPEGKLFVLGDNREVSVDSRNSAIGTISEEQRVGKLVFRVWPISSFGTVK